MRTAQSPIEQANGDPWLYSDQKIGLVNLENVLQVPHSHLEHVFLVFRETEQMLQKNITNKPPCHHVHIVLIYN